MERLQFFYISDKKIYLQNFPPLFSFTNLIPRSRNFLTKTSIFLNSFLSRTYIFLPLSKISFFFFFRQKKVLLFLLFLAPNIMDLSITTFLFQIAEPGHDEQLGNNLHCSSNPWYRHLIDICNVYRTLDFLISLADICAN